MSLVTQMGVSSLELESDIHNVTFYVFFQVKNHFLCLESHTMVGSAAYMAPLAQ